MTTIENQIEILLIEDNPDEAELAIRSLKNSNLANKLIHIDDGEEAIHYIFGTGPYAHLASAEFPILILLDLNLPKVNGLDILKLIKNDLRTKSIPVVVLTSSAEEKDILHSYQMGVNSYIVKPVNFDSFCQAIKELHMYWVVLNQSPSISR